MTVGEKIQYYRKKAGLSQEDLGQKLLVSRQTVSLWEMDKTLPTVDNLRLLKELFSVSVDEILDESEPTEETEEIKPKETYVFGLDKNDQNEVNGKMRKPVLTYLIVSIVASVALFVLCIAFKAHGVLRGLVTGWCLAVIVHRLFWFFFFKKTQKRGEEKLSQSTLSYEVYDSFFVLTVTRGGEITRTHKVYFSEVENVHSFEKFLVLEVTGTLFVLKKELLSPDSVFYSLAAPAPAIKEEIDAKPDKRLVLVSTLLFLFSIFSLFGALFGVEIANEFYPSPVENMWVFLLFLPIPVASIVFGFYLKKKRQKYKKNVIVGFIMAALLAIYGSFGFLLSDVYSHDDAPVLRVEEALGIDIPEYTQINTQDWTKGTQYVARGTVISTSDVYFDDAAVAEFESKLGDDPKWIDRIPSDLVGITSTFCDSGGDDYYIIYNKTTKEYNTLPAESGTYEFINVLYSVKDNSMTLVEYTIEYVK